MRFFNLFLLVALIHALTACNEKNAITITNSLDVDRVDEAIIIDRQDLADMIGNIPEGMAPVVSLNGKLVPSQVDDMDGNGIWDEFVFTIDIASNSSTELKVDLVDQSEYPQFEKRTNLRLGIIQDDGTYKEYDEYTAPSCTDSFVIIAQGESVSWENDKMAFRNYFDCRNVKDLFGKLLPGMIIDKIHTPEIENYHVLSDWGMDVLHCGSSLGSGGLAMLEEDSLYRLGSTAVYEYQKVVEGPVRSVFDLKYEGWDVAGESLDAVERISVYPGKFWFQSDVTVSGFSGEKQLATGIVTSKLKNDPVAFDSGKEHYTITTLDAQSENNDTLGMAVMIEKSELTKIDRTTDINYFNLGYKTVIEKGFSQVVSETYYIAQKIENETPARHYFFAVWGLEDSKWNDLENLKDYISSEALKLENPVLIDIK